MNTGRCVRDFERRKKAFEDDSISEVVGEFTRRMTWTVGFDHRAFPDDCGGGGHGQHGMELRFILIGADGAVQWMVNWGDMVPGNVDVLGSVPQRYPKRDMMSAYDLGHHWRHPTYHGELRMDDCDLLDGQDFCFYDGSGLRAGELVGPFLKHGPGAIWKALEREYDRLRADELARA